MPDNAVDQPIQHHANGPFSGTPPGSQQSFLQALLGRTVHVALIVPGAQQTGILRGVDASTITLELTPEDGTDVAPRRGALPTTATPTAMLVYKTAILSITPV